MTGRTISVGVDEAGYAPKLGPLVVTATSIERPAENADLYAMLSPSVASSRRTAGAHPPKPLLVADSKVVYRPGGGLAGLERGVISFLRAADVLGDALASDLGLIGAVSHSPPDLDGLPWYGGAPEPLPVEADADDIRLAAHALAQVLSRAGCGRPAFRSRVITARELNKAIASGLNKADLLVEVVAGLLAAACEGNGARNRLPGRSEGCFAQTVPGTVSRDASNLPTLSVLVDRLGGRKDYSRLLAKAFPRSEVRELSLSPTESRYRVGAGCEVTFACRAESRCMTVALSSMVSKYARELMMRRLNRYFAERMPGLKPTAGYPVDAARFLEDTRDLRRREGIRDELFIRAR